MMSALALLVSAFGLVAGVTVFTATRDLRAAAGATLELWTGAGLLHLAATASATSIAIAAAVVAVRKLVLVRPTIATTGRRPRAPAR